MPKPASSNAPQTTRKRFRSDHSMMRLIIKLFAGGELRLGINQHVSRCDNFFAFLQTAENFNEFITDATEQHRARRVMAVAVVHINHRPDAARNHRAAWNRQSRFSFSNDMGFGMEAVE